MDITAQLKHRLAMLVDDCRLIHQCLDDGPEYHNLDLLEKHLASYLALCAQVIKE